MYNYLVLNTIRIKKIVRKIFFKKEMTVKQWDFFLNNKKVFWAVKSFKIPLEYRYIYPCLVGYQIVCVRGGGD